ncbi:MULTISPECIES: hypothetical protein [unclassified Chryseobacterium]|jgi:hypothetical protein|uniref:hypothetical protein n=1 Tax=unclassified Chryseobacterium TaxID=2593645 RepID=UPI00095638C0|nr:MULTISPECIES: hypothetical protein [unclassified Chryseobacterium]PXW16099.1 hypothetical protein C8D70_10436 [Chryseobacterium sp. CBTAP 102]SIR71368.1 hypothetical protein SAMN05880573_1376 [Chryseobacterium sp. RU33C]
MNHKHKKGWIFLLLCPPLILAAVTWIVMMLWNCLLPEILGARTITFWQAMGILILSKILFGGFHFGKGMRDFKERKMREKMEGLSPEEREKFKEVWRNRCSGGFFNRNNE